jgi:tetratricopeptide (TPR) repeat protein
MGPTRQDTSWQDGETLRRAVAHYQAGRSGEAAAFCREILGRNPRHPEALNLAGVLAAQGGDLARGRALIESALAEQPGTGQYHANLGQVMLLAGDEAAAGQAYRRCVAVDPTNALAWMNFGNILLKAERILEAEECFLKALASEQNLAEAHAGLGFVLQRQHRRKEAIAAFERAASLDPDNPALQSNLGGLLLEIGALGKAVARLGRAVALAPENADCRIHLGVAHHFAGDPETALGHYDAALVLQPGNVRAVSYKGLALVALGRNRKAGNIFDHERLIVIKQISAVQGYEGPKALNLALEHEILAHPTLMANHTGKTTRGGGQTGELLGPSQGPFAALEHLGGYQDPHNHPGGVLSGVYYVKLPASIRAAAEDSGGIAFGRANARFGHAELPGRRIIRPKEGRSVLFPSHFWHHTIPFHSAEKRISIAFDLIPRT